MNTPRRVQRTTIVVALLLVFLTALQFTVVSRSAAQSYHYEPVPGLVVGLSVDAWASGQLAVFRHQYGFSGALVNPNADYDSARAAGLAPSSIMVVVISDDYQTAVQTREAGWYYIDESVEHDCYGHPTALKIFTPSELAARRDFIRINRPGALFVSSGYKRCSHLRAAGPACDIIMFSSYRHWRKLTFSLCNVNMGWGDNWEAGWVPAGGDQRPSWSDMRNLFGSKFAMTWVHGGGDEYDILLGHARNLGLTGIWMYHEGPVPSDKMEQFLAAAVKHGWLRRVDGPGNRVAYASRQATVVNRRHVAVSWATTWEIDIRRYELERRPESGGAYTAVTGKETAGNGTTLTPHSYAVTDSLVPAGGWWYRTVGVSSDGARFPAEPVFVRVPATIVAGTSDAPMPAADNYPNPFNPATEIRFSVPAPAAGEGVDAGGAAGWVTLKVYDLLGREVAVLVDERRDPGTYTVTFNAHGPGGRSGGLASGVYLYRLTAGGSTITRRMLLTK